MNAILVFILRLLLILLSYTFVGWIGYTIYTDLKISITQRKAISATPTITLEANLDDKFYKKQLNLPEIILGRDPTCDFPLDDETVSLRHCKLSFQHKQWWVEDLDSTNGSFLNNQLIEGATILTINDEIRLGNVDISITITN